MVRLICCPWPDGGCAESLAPASPVKVPVTSVMPLKMPVLVSRFMATKELEIKPKKIGGTPPEVCIWNE